MIKKIVTVIAIVFIGQTLVSCLFNCNCPEPINSRITYINLAIKGINTSGYEISDIDQSIYRSNLGLEIDVQIEEEIIGFLHPVNWGFSNAMACSCADPFYEISDKMVNFELYMINPETDTVENVTTLFNVYIGSSSYISIEKLFSEYGYYGSRDPFFRLAPETTDFIPSSAIFTANIFLESGKMLTNQTSVINFID